MKQLATLERPFDVIRHQLDTIDHIADVRAHEIVDLTAEQIQADKATELIKVFDKLNAQFASRRVGNTVHIGDIVSESTTFATRTPDWTGLDEIFTRETIYDPVLRRPMSRYSVEMLNNRGKNIVVLHSDNSMRFMAETDGTQTELSEQEADALMLDLVLRAEVAVGAYEIRKEAAAEDGLDPRSYSDLADANARAKLIEAGYVDLPQTTLE